MSQVEGQGSQVELLRCERGANALEVLKALRILAGCGLREAKEAFEACEHGQVGVVVTPSLEVSHQLASELQALGVTSRVRGTVYSDLSSFEAPAWVHRQKGTFILNTLRLEDDEAVLEGRIEAGTLDARDTLAVLFLDGDIVSFPVAEIEQSKQKTEVLVSIDAEEPIDDLLAAGDHLLILALAAP
ncbi:MAG: hypothetical protein AAGG50_02550 [Bacteroidota bacterium]